MKKLPVIPDGEYDIDLINRFCITRYYEPCWKYCAGECHAPKDGTEACAAYYLALANPDCDLEKCREIASESNTYAHLFARDVDRKSFEDYQEISCKQPDIALIFLESEPFANIKYCQKHVCRGGNYIVSYASSIPESDMEYCYEKARANDKKAIIRCIHDL